MTDEFCFCTQPYKVKPLEGNAEGQLACSEVTARYQEAKLSWIGPEKLGESILVDKRVDLIYMFVFFVQLLGDGLTS